MKKFTIELKWGIIFNIAVLLWILLEKLMGWHGNHIEQYALNTWFFLIPATHIYVSAIINKRDKFYHGKMNWIQGFLAGLGITMVVVLLNPLLQYIHSKIISPGFFINAISYSINSGKMSQVEASKIFNLKNFIFQGLFRTFIFGIVVSAIVPIFVKKK